MKIKLFEDFTEKLYKEINLFEWQDKCKKTFEKLTKSEIDWINQFENKLIPDVKKYPLYRWKKFGVCGPHPTSKSDKVYYAPYIQESCLSLFWSDEINPQELEWSNRLIQCLKIEDDYFVCQIPYKEVTQTHRFFICDTIEGVKELFQELELTL
jgi:hypothetical protein